MLSQAPSPEALLQRPAGDRSIAGNTFGDGVRIHQGDVIQYSG